MTIVSSPAPRAGSESSVGIALARLGNVIVDPVAAFRDVARYPTAAITFAALIALRFGSVLLFYQPAVDPGRLVAGILFQLVTVWPLTFMLTLLLWTSTLVWGVRVTWLRIYSVVVHVVFAHTLLTVAVASVAGALLPADADVDLRHPPFTNLGSFVSAADSPVAHAFVAELDVRSLYALVLVWLGVRAALDNRDGRCAARIVASCLVVHLLMVGLSAVLRA